MFITMPTGSTPQSLNTVLDQPPPALIPIPGSQHSGMETGSSESVPSEAPPTKRGRVCGRGRIGGRGRGARTDQGTSGGMFSCQTLMMSLWVWPAVPGDRVIVRRRRRGRGLGRGRLSIHDSTPRTLLAGSVAGGDGGGVIIQGTVDTKKVSPVSQCESLSNLSLSLNSKLNLNLPDPGGEEEGSGDEGQVRQVEEEGGDEAPSEGHSDPEEGGAASEEGERESDDEGCQGETRHSDQTERGRGQCVSECVCVVCERLIDLYIHRYVDRDR